MSRKEKIAVTKSTYIRTDGRHAFYPQGQSYAGVTGGKIFEAITSEGFFGVTHKNGKRSLSGGYDGSWLRVSEDHGLHWADYGEKFCFDAESTEEQMMPSGFGLDEKNDILVRFYYGRKADKNCYGHVDQGTYRAFHSISRDQGVTWSEPVQIVDMRKGYDAVSWGPGFAYGERGGLPHECVWLDDGSVVVPFTVYERLDGTKPWYFWVICARGYWKKDMSGFEWVFGDRVEVKKERAAAGCNEPTITALAGDNLFMVTRCGGATSETLKEVVKRWGTVIEEQRSGDLRAMQAMIDAGQGVYSTRYSAFSEDGGMTWSAPEPLAYDDGTTVWTPASYSAFYESSRTGKTYWIANILNKPVYRQTPRYPLTIAEFDRNKRCIVKDSVQVIQDKPEGANENVRYTNFGRYEDRKKGNLIITLPEQFLHIGPDEIEKPEDFAADSVKYEVELA